MPDITVGLANQSSAVEDAEVKRVAAALLIQIRRDLKPVWDRDADVVVIDGHAPVPRGIWPVFITDHPPGGYAGLHTKRSDGLPWAVVSTKRDWRLAASHEVVEMLVDPNGDTPVSSLGLALDGDALRELETEVDYLLEVCDPMEDTDHAYTIDDVPVSDFYTPNYFDRTVVAGRVYSVNGAITRPREVRPGGYLSWRDPATRRLHQLRNFSGFTLVDLPENGPADNQTLRMFVDQHTQTPRVFPDAFA